MWGVKQIVSKKMAPNVFELFSAKITLDVMRILDAKKFAMEEDVQAPKQKMVQIPTVMLSLSL